MFTDPPFLLQNTLQRAEVPVYFCPQRGMEEAQAARRACNKSTANNLKTNCQEKMSMRINALTFDKQRQNKKVTVTTAVESSSFVPIAQAIRFPHTRVSERPAHGEDTPPVGQEPALLKATGEGNLRGFGAQKMKGRRFLNTTCIFP